MTSQWSWGTQNNQLTAPCGQADDEHSATLPWKAGGADGLTARPEHSHTQQSHPTVSRPSQETHAPKASSETLELLTSDAKNASEPLAAPAYKSLFWCGLVVFCICLFKATVLTSTAMGQEGLISINCPNQCFTEWRYLCA